MLTISAVIMTTPMDNPASVIRTLAMILVITLIMGTHFTTNNRVWITLAVARIDLDVIEVDAIPLPLQAMTFAVFLNRTQKTLVQKCIRPHVTIVTEGEDVPGRISIRIRKASMTRMLGAMDTVYPQVAPIGVVKDVSSTTYIAF